MHREGHIGATLIAYGPLGFGAVALGFPVAGVGGGALAVALAMVPDWDLRVPGLAHRGVTHTVQFAGAVAILSGLLGAGMGASAPTAVGPFEIAGAAVFAAATGGVAILSHIAADALTPMGVDPFGEDEGRLSYDVCRADSTLGNYGLLGIGVVVTLVAFYAGQGVNAVLRV